MKSCRILSLGSVAVLLLVQSFSALAQTDDAATAPDPASAPAPAVPKLMLNLSLSSATREVVKLVTGGISPDVIKSYIDNSASAFNLTADGIIKVQNAGVPNNLITAMMAHDKEMRDRGQIATLPPPQPQYPQYPPPDQSGAMPPPGYPPSYGYDQSAPPPDYSDLSPYGSWYYDQPAAEWYWSPYPSLWNYGYPWGIGVLNNGRWWYHNSHGWVWSHGYGNRGGRTYYSAPPYRGGGTQVFARGGVGGVGGVHATVIHSGFSRGGSGGGGGGGVAHSFGGFSAGGHR